MQTTLVKEVTNKKIRIDKLLFEKGLAESRSKAQSLIMAGVVYADDKKVDKPGTLVNTDSKLEVKSSNRKYVSRGGLKLEAALSDFKIDVADLICLDIGASTGGFTDCLLKHGAAKVFAFDVGYGQLDWNLRNNERVIVRERINCRYLKTSDIGELVDLVVVDVSFISLNLILQPAIKNLKSEGKIIALIKPQFEVGKDEVGKGGIVKDTKKHNQVIEKISSHLLSLGCNIDGVSPSPILGADGNKEFFICSTLIK